MGKLRAFLARLGEWVHRQKRDRELAEEIESHLQMHIADNLRSGMTPVEARRQALIKFGGLESTVETYRERRGFSFGATVLQDLRYAVRMLRKSPGFTAAVVLSLALGIGANTAIFSLIDAVMLKFLPVKNPEQLVLLNWASQRWPDSIIHQLSGNFENDPTGRSTSTSFSYPTFQELRTRNTTLASTFAFADTGKMNLSADGDAGLAEGELASGDYFSGLGVRAAIGRLFTDFDDRPDSPPTAVLSYGYWERRFGRNPSVVGKAITINGIPFTIIGVTSPEFFGLQPGTALDLWMPLRMQPLVKPIWTKGLLSKFLQRDDWWLMIMGRLRPGVSEQSALAQLGFIFRQSATDLGDSGVKSQNPGQSKTVSSQSESLTLNFTLAGKGLADLRNEFSKPLFILMAVVGLVLLIACANVANLLLARATSRHREIAVRLAVGAARRRLIRQLLTESVLLAAIGGAFGLLLAYFATHLLIALMSSGQRLIALNVRPDLHVLGFTAAISLFTGVLFGLAPALRGTRLDLTAALKDAKGSVARKRHARIGLGKVLVVSQLAMSLLLLAGAGLFVRTLVNLENIKVGFDQRNILLFGIDPTQKGYKGERIVEFYKELQRRIEALPSVRSATFSMLGQIGAGGWTENISIQGYAPQPNELENGSLSVSINAVGPRFLDTMSIPLLLGRSIEESDKGNSPKVAIINETFARKYLGASNPIGRRFGFGRKATDIEIVGVVADAKYGDLRRETQPVAYIPCFQVPELDLVPVTFAVRTMGNPTTLIPGVRLAEQSLDKDLPLSNVKTQVEQIEQTLFQERLFAKLSSFFGSLALILTCIGIYGIMSYAVARRTNEIGIRMALGARQEDILRKVLREALALVLVGIAIGIPIALGALRLISSMLFGLKATDPLTLAGAIAFMLAVAVIAGYLPAKRASRVDPIVALRYE